MWGAIPSLRSGELYGGRLLLLRWVLFDIQLQYISASSSDTTASAMKENNPASASRSAVCKATGQYVPRPLANMNL